MGNVMKGVLALTALAAVVGIVTGDGLAAGSKDYDPRVLGPRDGAAVKAGERKVVFRVRVERPDEEGGKRCRPSTYGVFMRVSRSDKRKDGLLAHDAYIGEMCLDKTNSTQATFALRPDRPKKYTYSGYWLNNNKQKTYYWQSYLVYCVKKTCVHPGEVRKLIVTP